MRVCGCVWRAGWVVWWEFGGGLMVFGGVGWRVMEKWLGKSMVHGSVIRTSRGGFCFPLFITQRLNKSLFIVKDSF